MGILNCVAKKKGQKPDLKGAAGEEGALCCKRVGTS